MTLTQDWRTKFSKWNSPVSRTPWAHPGSSWGSWACWPPRFRISPESRCWRGVSWHWKDRRHQGNACRRSAKRRMAADKWYVHYDQSIPETANQRLKFQCEGVAYITLSENLDSRSYDMAYIAEPANSNIFMMFWFCKFLRLGCCASGLLTCDLLLQ